MFCWLKPIDESGPGIKAIVQSEGIGESITNSTEEAFSLNSFAETAFGKAITVAKGITFRNQTEDIWTGTDKREIAFEIRFVALSNPPLEVFEPVRMLQRWAMPSQGAKTTRITDKARSLLGADRNVAQFLMNPPTYLHVRIGESQRVPLIEIKRGIIVSLAPSWAAPFATMPKSKRVDTPASRGPRGEDLHSDLWHGYPMMAEVQLTIKDIMIQNKDTFHSPQESSLISNATGGYIETGKHLVANQKTRNPRGILRAIERQAPKIFRR